MGKPGLTNHVGSGEQRQGRRDLAAAGRRIKRCLGRGNARLGRQGRSERGDCTGRVGRLPRLGGDVGRKRRLIQVLVNVLIKVLNLGQRLEAWTLITPK